MLSNIKLLFLLSLALLFLLWKEAQGRCSSCPSNGCSQTGMSQGKCYRARYYTTSYKTSYYVTTYYYQGTSQGSSTYKCGFWNRKRCTRYHTVYHRRSTSSLRYKTQHRSNMACDAYCCAGHTQYYNGCCIDETSNDTVAEGAVRLVGGNTSLEGRVEVFLLGQWGTVCDERWDLDDAMVVCHQLCNLQAVEAPRSAFFGAGSGPSWYYSLYCTGAEQNLTECCKNTYNFGSACSHSRDAGAVCSRVNIVGRPDPSKERYILIGHGMS